VFMRHEGLNVCLAIRASARPGTLQLLFKPPQRPSASRTEPGGPERKYPPMCMIAVVQRVKARAARERAFCSPLQAMGSA
jgi:hypothetical protein